MNIPFLLARIAIGIGLHALVIGSSMSEEIQLDTIDHSSYISTISTTSTVPTTEQPVPEITTNTKTSTFNKPTTVNLNVPFYAQAPLGDWSDPFQEACEEMSVLLVQAYLQNINWTKELISEEIVRFTNWVEENKYDESVTLQELAQISQDLYGLTSEIVYNPTEETITSLIDAGYPVIVPAAGQKLKNPYFSGDGPLYHMLVISGYNETNFITQEVGTRFGENYQYEKSHFLNSIHNLTRDVSQIENGERAVLVLSSL